MLFFVILILIGSCVLLYLKLLKRSNHNLPPGEDGFPLIGALTLLKPKQFISLQRLGCKFGPVFRIKLGLRNFIVLHSYEAFKEFLISQGNNFSGRNEDEYFFGITKGQGVLASHGATWHKQKQNALQILKNFGFGRELSKEIIHKEIVELLKTFEILDGAPIDNTLKLFSYFSANVISALCLKERHAQTDVKFQNILNIFDRLVNAPLVEYLPLFYPFLTQLITSCKFLQKRIRRLVDQDICYSYIQEKVDNRIKTFNPSEEPTDLINALLLLETKAKEEPDYNEELFKFSIVRTVFDFLIAGTDTTATSLSWAFFLLALHPEIQQKVQEELDLNCNKSEPIRMEHRLKLPYTCAVIDEILRFSSIAPLALIHQTMADTKIMGYTIPKKTLIIPNIYAVLHDPHYWEKPEDFYPQHFLSEDGKKYVTRDHLIAFSIGKRSCLGESLAVMEIFLFISNILREYKINLDGNISDKERQTLLMGNDGIVRHLSPHKLCFIARNKK